MPVRHALRQLKELADRLLYARSGSLSVCIQWVSNADCNPLPYRTATARAAERQKNGLHTEQSFNLCAVLSLPGDCTNLRQSILLRKLGEYSRELRQNAASTKQADIPTVVLANY